MNFRELIELISPLIGQVWDRTLFLRSPNLYASSKKSDFYIDFLFALAAIFLGLLLFESLFQDYYVLPISSSINYLLLPLDIWPRAVLYGSIFVFYDYLIRVFLQKNLTFIQYRRSGVILIRIFLFYLPFLYIGAFAIPNFWVTGQFVLKVITILFIVVLAFLCLRSIYRSYKICYRNFQFPRLTAISVIIAALITFSYSNSFTIISYEKIYNEEKINNAIKEQLNKRLTTNFKNQAD